MIDSKFIERWRNKMLKDLSVTSVAIYLRSFRVVCRRAIDMGLMKQQDKLFDSKVVNRSNSRKDEYLDVKTMTTLWRLFESGEAKTEEGTEYFTPMYKRNTFYSLGLFLFMYLADGLNLADAARLKYDDYYFNNGRKAFKFLRHKTAERNEDSEVIFPILPQLRTIIDRIGNNEEQGRYVFPILRLHMKEVDERRLIAQENSNIRDRMVSVCEYLGISQRPSPTWCRHSFATNLTHLGVPERYIKQSMGHSLKGDVTSRYIDDYSHEQMISYNALLLNDERQDKLNKLAGLSDEQLSKLLSMV
jgi:integrase